MNDHKYLKLLSKDYKNVQSAATELINLNAILNLPKGTEYFIADIHGEYDAFNHFLKNASGIIDQKINDRFKMYTEKEKNRLAFFIYYPTDMLTKYQNKLSDNQFEQRLRQVLIDMVELARLIVSKYTQSKVRKSLPEEFSYVMLELIYESRSHEDKKRYYDSIIDAVFKTGRANKLIVEMSRVIRYLAVDRLHVVGDIFDRGPHPHLVMEKLMKRKYVDIQWGNHDIIWMGAASGCLVSIANVIRIAARYNNLDYLEDGYGINLRPLAQFAMTTYKNDPCHYFEAKNTPNSLDQDEMSLVAKIHKAIAIIQFKVERDLILRNPHFKLNNRLLLDKIDPKAKTVKIDGQTYDLLDANFPTINFNNDPYKLTLEEHQVMKHLKQLFIHNEMLQKHVKYLFQKGSMHLKVNDTLLFHAAIPLNEDKTFAKQTIDQQEVAGKALFEALEKKIRFAYLHRYDKHIDALDYFIYLWQGMHSPLFAKSAMKTFERYFIKDKAAHKEHMNPYFTLREDETVLKQIFTDFNLDPSRGKIINGHVPTDVTRGDQAVLANKRIYLIDGGMSKQYAKRTSIGGYSLISDSYAFYLVSHARFDSHEALIHKEKDIVSITHSEDLNNRRTYIYDTDKGLELKETIHDLEALIKAYRQGIIKEKSS